MSLLTKVGEQHENARKDSEWRVAINGKLSNYHNVDMMVLVWVIKASLKNMYFLYASEAQRPMI